MVEMDVGVDSDPHLERTPDRIVHLWRDLFGGLHERAPEMSVFDCEPDARDPVVIAGLPLYSMCAHHMLPFFGDIDIAYIPEGRLGGVGSFSRIIGHYARRPQIQERLIEQVVNHIQDELKPRGVFVRVSARHLCMEMRGEKVCGGMVNTAARGLLEELPRRAEVLELIKSARAFR
jgi:GTP cyclohydrolase I